MTRPMVESAGPWEPDFEPGSRKRRRRPRFRDVDAVVVALWVWSL